MLTEKAKQTINLVNRALGDRASIHVIYIDRYGDVEMRSEEMEGGEPDWVSLMDRASLGSPYFEICSVGENGEIMTVGGDFIEIGDVDSLQEAIDLALSERTRFYTERSAEYGPTAWPLDQRISAQ